MDGHEYQKRGLPHDHALYWFSEQDKIKTSDGVDRIISAEIPDPDEDPEYYELVTRLQMHGPCTPEKPCMATGRCNKGFPKPFRETTFLEKGKYPQYRRRDNGRSITRTYKGVTYVLTNQHVVPHNPYLLKYFKSHMCIEICALLYVIAYAMDYLMKGNDKAAVRMTGDGFEPVENIQFREHDNITELMDEDELQTERVQYVEPTTIPNQSDNTPANLWNVDNQSVGEAEEDMDIHNQVHDPIDIARGENFVPYNEIDTYISNIFH